MKIKNDLKNSIKIDADNYGNNGYESEDKNKNKNNNKKRTRVKLRVLRINANNNKSNFKPHFDEFEVPVNKWTTVLDALIQAKNYHDSSIAIRYSCRMGSCGSSGMKINGKLKLACYTTISELDSETITCEPLPNFPYIKDLVTDFSVFFQHHKNMMPYIQNKKIDNDVADNNNNKEELSEYILSNNQLDKFIQFSDCIKCGLCYSACPTVATDIKFPGPQALSQAYRYLADARDSDRSKRLNVIDTSHGIWRCHFAGSCSVVCPKGVDPALGIQLLRNHILGFSKNEKKIARLRDRFSKK
jgi:succinate dehydrogenase / fumarate reductase, iron-sulfur subunit